MPGELLLSVEPRQTINGRKPEITVTHLSDRINRVLRQAVVRRPMVDPVKAHNRVESQTVTKGKRQKRNPVPGLFSTPKVILKLRNIIVNDKAIWNVFEIEN